MGTCYKLVTQRKPSLGSLARKPSLGSLAKKPSLGSLASLDNITDVCKKIIEQIEKVTSLLEKLLAEKEKEMQESIHTKNIKKVKESVEDIQFYNQLITFIPEKTKNLKEQIEDVKKKKDFQSARTLIKELKETEEFVKECVKRCKKKKGEESEESKQKTQRFMNKFFTKNNINKEEFDKKVEAKIKEIEDNQGVPEQNGNQEIQWGETVMTNEVLQ